MNKYMKVFSLLAVLLLTTVTSSAQRSRAIGDGNAQSSKPAAATTTTENIAPAPQTVKAKYEGGVFGYNKKVNGTLSFDDANSRLVFRNEQQRELLSVPYKSILATFADTRARRPTAATVIGGASIYTLPALLIRKKYRYLTVQFKDPDTQASGITSFKLDNKDTLTSVVNTLASKSGLTQRGEIYVRRNEGASQQ